VKLTRRQAPITFAKRIPSRTDEAESLSRAVRDLLHANGLAESCFRVELLVRECLANAVVHGNRMAADKYVDFRLTIGRERISIEIADQGPGFDWRKARRLPLDTTRSSGRGLQFCALYAERIRFNRSGNRITLWIGKSKRSEEGGSKMAAYVVEQKDQLGSVKLEGDLTAATVPDLQTDLKQLLNRGARELVFDLASTAMLDSSGMGLLIAAANSLAPSGGKVRVTNVCPDIYRLLQSMRLTARLNVSVMPE
jgi:serine/threonine-protein kinase RsbW